MADMNPDSPADDAATAPSDAASARSRGRSRPAVAAPRGAHSSGRFARAISITFRIVLGCAFIGVGFGIYAALVNSAPTIEPRSDENGAARLLVVEPKLIPIQRAWTGFGTAEATDRADVPARVTAIVVEVPAAIEAGRSVRAGELLVRLDESDFQRQVESATAAIAELDAQLDRISIEADAAAERVRLANRDLEIARADEDRVRRATEAEAARQRELDTAIQRTLNAERAVIAAREAVDSLRPRRAQLAALRLAQESILRRAEDDVDRCIIRAPIDGVLQAVDVKLGENVAAGQRIARVVGLERIEIPIRLPASARREIAVGDPVELSSDGRAMDVRTDHDRTSDDRTSDDRRERRWRAEVVRIAPQDDPQTRTMTIFAELSQSADDVDLLPPGRFVQGSVLSGRPVMRSVIPRRAVRADRVLVVRDGFVRSEDIAVDFTLERSIPEFGLDDTLWVALQRPLADGDLVVVDGGRGAVPGQAAVAILPSGREARAAATAVRPESSGSTAP